MLVETKEVNETKKSLEVDTFHDNMFQASSANNLWTKFQARLSSLEY